MGSTGNVYNVIIKDNPSCSCPDYTTKKKRCKHIFLILLKIMKISDKQSEESKYKKMNCN